MCTQTIMTNAFKEITKFEEMFNLPKKFYLNLLEEQDWGFIIKLHSLFEGAATHVLNLRLGEGKIEPALSALEFGHEKYGKVTLLSNLGILNSNQVKFLRLLSELRNKLVHNIQNVSFSLTEYLNSIDKNQKKSFCERIGYNCNDPIKVSDKSVPRNKFIIENPKLSIWLTASDVLACLRIEEELVSLDRDKLKLNQETLGFAKKIIDMNALMVKNHHHP